MQVPDDDDAKRVLEATPAAQIGDDAFPELPLGVEAFRSPLHTLPAGPPAQESASHARRAYLVVSTLAIGVGIFAALAVREPSPELTVARDDDVVRAAGELGGAEASEPRRGAVAPALAPVAPSLLAAAPRPAERSSAQRPHTSIAATATPRWRESSSGRRDRRSGRQRMAAGRMRVKPADRTLAQLPTRSAVLAAMRKITRDARGCLGTGAVAQVDIGFSGETGKVNAVTVRGITGPAADCLAHVVRGAKLQPFAKPRLDITFPFRARK